MELGVQLLLLVFVFVAVLVQSLVGFGTALLLMPLLSPLLGLAVAAPLVAIISFTTQGLLFGQYMLSEAYRGAFNPRVTGRMVLGLAIGIPLGVLGVRRVDEDLMLLVLGALIVAYSLYSWVTPRLFRLRNSRWGYAFGFGAGVCGGAYNVPGPLAVVYGHASGWDPPQFRANLQVFFILNYVGVVAAHLIAGSFTPQIWHAYLTTLPLMVIALWVGSRVTPLLKPTLVNRLVLLLLATTGIGLVARHAPLAG